MSKIEDKSRISNLKSSGNEQSILDLKNYIQKLIKHLNLNY
jgi:hypothetical protein